MEFNEKVSTHSRAEAAAAPKCCNLAQVQKVSTHSRAEAAAEFCVRFKSMFFVSTHSRAEAAAPYLKKQEKSAY